MLASCEFSFGTDIIIADPPMITIITDPPGRARHRSKRGLQRLGALDAEGRRGAAAGSGGPVDRWLRRPSGDRVDLGKHVLSEGLEGTVKHPFFRGRDRAAKGRGTVQARSRGSLWISLESCM